MERKRLKHWEEIVKKKAEKRFENFFSNKRESEIYLKEFEFHEHNIVKFYRQKDTKTWERILPKRRHPNKDVVFLEIKH